MVSGSGKVTGMGTSTKFKTNFNVVGTITANGELNLVGTGKAGAAKYMGTIDPQSGAVMGMWQFDDGSNKQGTFSGRKQ